MSESLKISNTVAKLLVILVTAWLAMAIGCLVAVAPFSYLYSASFRSAAMTGAHPVQMIVAIWLTVAGAFAWIVFLTIRLSRLENNHSLASANRKH